MNSCNGLRLFFISILLFLFGTNISFAQGQISESGVEFLSAGIGDDESPDAISDKYNLKLVFATQGSGEYVADVSTAIEKSKGEKIIETISAGPHFYVALPPGSYRITAEFKGKMIRKAVSIRSKKRQVSYFYWPEQAQAQPGQAKKTF